MEITIPGLPLMRTKRVPLFMLSDRFSALDERYGASLPGTDVVLASLTSCLTRQFGPVNRRYSEPSCRNRYLGLTIARTSAVAANRGQSRSLLLCSGRSGDRACGRYELEPGNEGAVRSGPDFNCRHHSRCTVPICSRVSGPCSGVDGTAAFPSICYSVPGGCHCFVSSIITSIVAAVVLVEVLRSLRLPREKFVQVTVVDCMAIGLGASWTPLGEPLSTIAIDIR